MKIVNKVKAIPSLRSAGLFYCAGMFMYLIRIRNRVKSCNLRVLYVWYCLICVFFFKVIWIIGEGYEENKKEHGEPCIVPIASVIKDMLLQLIYIN